MLLNIQFAEAADLIRELFAIMSPDARVLFEDRVSRVTGLLSHPATDDAIAVHIGNTVQMFSGKMIPLSGVAQQFDKDLVAALGCAGY